MDKSKIKRKSKKAAPVPVFSFTDSNGLNREVRQNWIGARDLKIGDSVEIIYNPEYTTIARRNSFWYIHGTSIFLTFLFLLFFAVGLYYFKRLWQN